MFCWVQIFFKSKHALSFRLEVEVFGAETLHMLVGT
jgi:hypothetical protein